MAVAGGDGLHSHLFTSRNALCALKQWDQSPSFSQVFFFKEVEAQRLKGAGYLILPEQTCNVQGRVETMAFCSRLNPFDLSADSVMAYKPQ